MVLIESRKKGGNKRELFYVYTVSGHSHTKAGLKKSPVVQVRSVGIPCKALPENFRPSDWCLTTAGGHPVGWGSPLFPPPTVHPDLKNNQNLERRAESECNADTISVLPTQISIGKYLGLRYSMEFPFHGQ